MGRKKQLLEELVDRRRENQSLRNENRRWNWFGWVVLALVAVAVVLPGIFLARVSPVHPEMWSEPVEKPVVVPVTEYRVFERNYNESLENGFCLFGYVSEDQVMVSEVVFVQNPMHQERGEIEFSCLQAMVNSWKRILLSSEYNLIGSVHTHPEKAYLSRVDARNLGTSSWWVSVKGIYNGNKLNFFAFGEPAEAMDMSLISVGGKYGV